MSALLLPTFRVLLLVLWRKPSTLCFPMALMLIYIGPTKTAAIAVPAGPGSRAVRRQFFSTGKGQLAILPENRGAFRLDLVSRYRHLGSIIAHDGCMIPEIKHRLAAGRTALKEGKQRLFACKGIPLARRATIFRTHVLSAVMSGAGTWPLLNGQEWQAYAGGVISMIRQLLCLRTGRRVPLHRSSDPFPCRLAWAR